MATMNTATGTVSLDAGGSVNATIAASAMKEQPKSVQKYIHTLKRAFSTAATLRGAFFDRKQSLHRDRAELGYQIAAVTGSANRKGGIGPDDRKTLDEFQAQLEMINADIAAIDSDIANIPPAYNPEGLTVWLANNAGKRFRPNAPAIALRKGQSLQDALTEVRAQITEKGAEAEEIELAELPASESTATVFAEIDKIAERGAPYFGRARFTNVGPTGRIRPGRIRWPVLFDKQGAEIGDAFALCVWANRAAIIAAAKAELAATESENNAIPLGARTALIAEARAEVEKLECLEGAILQKLSAEGTPATIRPDMSIAALLGVEVLDGPEPTPEPEAEPTDSPEHLAADLKRARARG